MNRDATFEGIFYVGVRDDGHLLPALGCVRQGNPAPEERRSISLRPVTRSWEGATVPVRVAIPLETERRAPALVRRLCEVIEQAPEGKVTSADLLPLGIDPSTARRQFQAPLMGRPSTRDHRARRLGLALHQVRNGGAVIEAQLDTGFDSASGFWEAFRRVFGAAPSHSAQVHCLQSPHD